MDQICSKSILNPKSYSPFTDICWVETKSRMPLNLTQLSQDLLSFRQGSALCSDHRVLNTLTWLLCSCSPESFSRHGKRVATAAPAPARNSAASPRAEGHTPCRVCMYHWVLHADIPGRSVLHRSPTKLYYVQRACELPTLHLKPCQWCCVFYVLTSAKSENIRCSMKWSSKKLYEMHPQQCYNSEIISRELSRQKVSVTSA